MTNYVQPIVVLKSGSHADTVRAAAAASLAAMTVPLLAGDPIATSWETWLEGRFTKTVRRAREVDLGKVAALHGAHEAVVGSSRAIALAPAQNVDFHPLLRRAQVAGTDFPRTVATTTPAGGPELLVLTTLTTGKAAAQAAHALWMWALPLLTDSPETISDWQSLGAPFGLRFVSSDTLSQTASPYRVVDAGLTEIEANTLTAVALKR